jgi:hypothetical protein
MTIFPDWNQVSGPEREATDDTYRELISSQPIPNPPSCRTGWVRPDRPLRPRDVTADSASVVPWLHYVPVKPSYDDLYDIAAFFIGPIGADGQVDTSLGHPVCHSHEERAQSSKRKEREGTDRKTSCRSMQALGKEIGEAGRDFAREHWRWEVMQSYMFRVLLE